MSHIRQTYTKTILLLSYFRCVCWFIKIGLRKWNYFSFQGIFSEISNSKINMNMNTPNYHTSVTSTRHFHTTATFFQPRKSFTSTRDFNTNLSQPQKFVCLFSNYNFYNEKLCSVWPYQKIRSSYPQKSQIR